MIPTLAREIDKLNASNSNKGIGCLINLSWYLMTAVVVLKEIGKIPSSQ